MGIKVIKLIKIICLYCLIFIIKGSFLDSGYCWALTGNLGDKAQQQTI